MKLLTIGNLRRSVLLSSLLLLPTLAEAVSFVKSVEYVELNLANAATTVSVNLTKGQIAANSVPFATMMMSGVDNEFDQLFTDVFFETIPTRVTAQRQTAGGTLSLGVFVVEFDPAFVRVQQNTFSMFAGVASTTAAITAVNLTKAAVVSYYRHGAVTNSWNDYAIAGWFSLGNQLSWQREFSAGAVNGHYYVFEALNAEFSVQPVSFTVAAGSPTGTTPITAVDMDKSFVVASYRTAYASDDNEDGQLGVFLANPTTVQAQRSFENSGTNAITDVRAFVVQFADNVRVQRGTLTYADTDTQQSAAIRSVDLASTLVWNGSSIGPGATQNEATSSIDGDTGFQRLKLQNATTVGGNRDGTCSGTDCGGIGHFEVVEWNPSGQMLVKSGLHIGTGVNDQPVFVGFQPDVVFIKFDVTGTWALVRTSTMAADNTKSLDAAGVALLTNRIKSFTPEGFTLGTSADVNSLGNPYYWIAFRAAPGELKVGTYTGNNTDNRSIPGVGFQPEYVITLPAAAGAAGLPVHRSATMTGDTSYDFDSVEIGPPANAIQAFEADGFQIGNANFVNTNLATYHYIAWNAVPGRVAVGSYVGDGMIDRNLDVVGFQPEWVLVKRDGDPRPWVHRPASVGQAADYTLSFADFSGTNDDIQQLRPLGFQVDFGPELPADRTNEPGITYHWIAFGPHPPQVNYRSIGAAGPHSAGTITATVGSTIVTGVGTGWRTANRGRGDSITFGGFTGTILSVDSETQLTLTSPATVGGSPGYAISRKFATLAAWENCIDGGGTSCAPDPAVPSASLVADDRSEVGIAYDEGVLARVSISGSVTDATHTITLTADPGNRHLGVAGGGVVVDGALGSLAVVLVDDDFVNVEWLEIKGGVDEGIEFQSLTPGSNGCVARNLLVHNTTKDAILIDDAGANVYVYNSIVYASVTTGIRIGATLTTGTVRIFNNTVYGNTGAGIAASGSNPTAILRNNISHSNGGAEFSVTARNAASSHNLSSDATGTTHSPAGGGQNSVPLGSLFFVSTAVGFENLHIQAGSAAQDTGTDLGGVVYADIDGGARVVPWDIGADDIQATTEVELVSFEALALDSDVLLSWETGSELKNLGFHVYRGRSSTGPSERLTSSLIPGLGSSPSGAQYRYHDSNLSNGTTYFYWLEDVETTGKVERHGPVSATPMPHLSSPSEETGNPVSAASLTYGDPSATSLRVVSRSSSELVLELGTGGFHAFPQDDGTVRIEVPDFVPSEGELGLPLKRHWLEAVVGRKVELSVRPDEVESFGLRPAQAKTSEIEARSDGTQRLRRSRASTARSRSPEEWARIANVAFQGDVKKALLELSPLQWNDARGELLLARKLTVTIRFRGREPGETASADGRRGRRSRKLDPPRGVVARLATTAPGLNGVRYEEVFSATRARSVAAGSLRLSRLGNAVPFHLEPNAERFVPGSTLFFVSEGAGANAYGTEAVYELEVGVTGARMRVESAAPSGASVGSSWATVALEQDRYYQAALLEAPDLWLWDILLAPSVKSFPFSLNSLAPSTTEAKLDVFLQGASDFPQAPDHHVRILLNGTFVGEDSWNGKEPRAVTLDILPGVLREGENVLEIENVGDTGALYSMVFLDRFTLTYPRLPVAEAGVMRGTWADSGTARVASLGAGARALDVSSGGPRWLTGARVDSDALRFHVEAGRSYLVVNPESVMQPEVRRASPVRWKKTGHRADYVAIGPRDLLEAARPLLEHRRSEGLRVASVPIDEIFDEAGYGETRPEAVRDFLSFAYHHWEGGVRYVLLLGDASYDFKDHLGTGAPNAVPALPIQTSFLWTVSDPGYAAVNGDDLLPDLAIGRLPAADAAELRVMVEKILAYESGATKLRGPIVLVTDNPDVAGNFDADASALESSVLASRVVRRVSLAELGISATRQSILDAFDEGASIVSYMGHGGIHLWASENLFSSDTVALLSPQSQQPLALTLNCLNGYFHFPFFDSLAEELVKADSKGAVAAFAPSGLSLNAPAHLLHESLLEELVNGREERLGDAVLRAQERFLEKGTFPELLAIYHLFGDPALRLR